jgi:hypothetical protein
MADIQDTIDQRYDYAPVVDDPADPMRGTVRGLFGLMTGERQRQVAAARQQLEMEARARQAERENRAYLLEASVQQDKFNREFPDLDVNIGGQNYNIRKLAQVDPELAKSLGSFELTRTRKKAQVEMLQADAAEKAAMAKIAAAQTKIQEEQKKQAAQFGPFTFGGPNQKTIDEQKRIIENESQTYGIPLGSEPEGAEPTPATQTGAASTWLRSRLK